MCLEDGWIAGRCEAERTFRTLIWESIWETMSVCDRQGEWGEQGGWWWWKDYKRSFTGGSSWIWSTNRYEAWLLWREKALVKVNSELWPQATLQLCPRAGPKKKVFPGAGGGAWGNGQCHSGLRWIQEPGRSMCPQGLWLWVHTRPITSNPHKASRREIQGTACWGHAICLVRTIVLEGPSRSGPW